MPSKHNLDDLRAAIRDTYSNVVAESDDNEAPNDEVLARLIAQRQSLLEFFTPQLWKIALTKLLNEECRKKASGESTLDQGELFEEIGLRPLTGLPKFVTIEIGKKKQPIDLSIRQAKRWIEDHQTRIVKNDNRAFADLVALCESFAESDDEKIRDVLQRKLESTQTSINELEPAE